jgi:mRNA interferase HigB
MRVIARKTLKEYWQKHPQAKAALKAWFAEAEDADWKTPADVKTKYASASIVGDRVVFNICGNKFRLVVRINYAFRVVYIRFLGTHAQYDEIKVEEI